VEFVWLDGVVHAGVEGERETVCPISYPLPCAECRVLYHGNTETWRHLRDGGVLVDPTIPRQSRKMENQIRDGEQDLVS
jgi:hypothetical protein